MLVTVSRKLMIAAVGEHVGRKANWSEKVNVGVVTRRLDRKSVVRLSAP